MSTKCDWCLRFKDDCEQVQLIGVVYKNKHENDDNKGNRSICLECRLTLQGQYKKV